MHSRMSLGWVCKALILALLLSLPSVRPAEASHLRDDAARLFYSKLAPYGTWIHHRIYGRVWFPRNMPAYWRPYQDGYWAYTYDYGWLWVSDWVWGWATDHYGRWVWDDWYGWIWVPGAVWAPAWVVWRYGDGYVSWAPLPIQYIWNPYVSYTTTYFNFDRYIYWDCWVTTHERDFPRRGKPRKFLPPKMNREILHRTRYADPLIVHNRNIVNQGIPLKRIERATGSSIKPVASEVVLEPGDNRPRERQQRNREEVRIYRPIDNQPTVETIRDEAESDKALAERIEVHRQLSSDRESQAGENLEPRRSGRLTGHPKPLDVQEAEIPLTLPAETPQTAPTFLTLPDMQETLQAEPGQDETVDRRDRRKIGLGRLQRQNQENVPEQPMSIEDRPQIPPQEQESEPVGRNGNRGQEPAAQMGQQQLELERQQQAEEELMRQEEGLREQQRQLEREQQAEQERMQQQEAVGRQEEGVHRYRENRGRRQQEVQELEQQEIVPQPLRETESRQQVEEGRMQQEAIRQQEEAVREQQRQSERQQQAEQQRMQQEAIRQQEEAVREQQMQAERQQQAEQQRMQQEAIRQQEEAVREQQLQMESQQQAEQQRMQQEAIRQQQQEMMRQQQLEMEHQQQSIQQQQNEMRQPETMRQTEPGSGRGRVGRGFGRGRE